MCGRFLLKEDVLSLNGITNKGYDLGEIYPSLLIPIVTNEKVIGAKWGFPNRKSKNLIINARVESLKDRPTFKELVDKNRCIIPVNGYYEWNGKDKYYINRSEKTMYLAGLYDRFKDESLQLSIFDKDSKIEKYMAFSLITKEANPSVSYIHHRMPLILERDEIYTWLGGEDLALFKGAYNQLKSGLEI